MQTETGYPLSKKRLVLSWYIDLLLFMVIWNLLTYFLNALSEWPSWAPYGLFILFEIALAHSIGSLGFPFLSIDKHTRRVDRLIYERETWWTVLTGVLLVLEGTKRAVRWTDMLVPQPLFGHLPEMPVQIVFHVVSGGLFILAGYWFLKLDIRAVYLSLALAATELLSIVMSWSLWDAAVEQLVIRRREMQNLPVRPEEVEFMQALIPEGMLILTLMLIAVSGLAYRRFRSA